jgi:hypothetical protein
MVVGVALTVSEVFDFTVKNDFNNAELTKKAQVYDITKTTKLMDISTDNTKDPTIVYDDTITAGNVRIIVTYYNTFIDITKDSTFLNDREVVYIDADGITHFNNIKKFINISIEGLKHKEVYNYEKALYQMCK